MFKIKTAATVVLVALLSMGNAYADPDPSDTGNAGGGAGGCGVGQSTNGCDGNTGGGGTNGNGGGSWTWDGSIVNRNVITNTNRNVNTNSNRNVNTNTNTNRNVNTNTNSNRNTAKATGGDADANAKALGVGVGIGKGGEGGDASATGGNVGDITINNNSGEGGGDRNIKYSGKYEVESMGTAYAPDIQATAGCRKPLSVGGSWLGGAFSAGTTFLDETCVQFENIRFGLTSQDPQTRQLANEVLRGRLAEDLYERLEDGKDVGSYDFEAMKADPSRAQNIRTTVKPDTSDNDSWDNYQELMGG